MRFRICLLTDDYEQLSSNLEDFVTTLVGYVRNGEEIDTALWVGEDDNEGLPPRLIQALKLDFKKVTATYNTMIIEFFHKWSKGGQAKCGGRTTIFSTLQIPYSRSVMRAINA